MLLEEVLENSPLAVSVKTRVGIKDPDEWEALCGVYAKFPLEELIIHPRLQNDYYSGTPRMETFPVLSDLPEIRPLFFSRQRFRTGSQN